jgi:hypothetical protein
MPETKPALCSRGSVLRTCAAACLTAVAGLSQPPAQTQEEQKAPESAFARDALLTQPSNFDKAKGYLARHALVPRPDERKLTDNIYRLQVEAILESNNDVIIHRIRIWTRQKRTVELHYGKKIGIEGLMRVEPDGLHYCATFVLLCLRHSEGAEKKAAKTVDIDFRIMVSGARGMTLLSDRVDPSFELKGALDLPGADGTHDVGSSTRLGVFRKTPLSIVVK